MKIPGLTFSWKRAIGLTQARQQLARKTGIPTSKAGLERKVGNIIVSALFGKKKRYYETDYQISYCGFTARLLG